MLQYLTLATWKMENFEYYGKKLSVSKTKVAQNLKNQRSIFGLIEFDFIEGDNDISITFRKNKNISKKQAEQN